MSTGRRAYDLLRGYVSNEWERIRGVEQTSAEVELRQAMEVAPRRQDPVAAMQEQLAASNTKDWARKVLGVDASSDFSAIRKAFERLNSRSDPAKFPVGSTESRQASDIQKTVQKAYAILAENVDATEKRFKTLEID